MLEPELIPTVKTDPGSPDYFKNLSGNVVILGGYRGSVLRDAETNMMMWIPIKVGVGLRRPTLELGLSTEAEEKSEELVYSSEPCMSIGRLVDMGKRLEERVAGRRQAKVHAWGYDWRLSLARSSKRLTKFLEELYEASADEASGKKRGAKVIAHSMGGLVALHALATCNNPRVFEGLVFASTPFRGTPNILGPFRFGDAALFNDTICSPRATFSFRSSFYLLPPDGRCFEVPVGEPDQDDDELTEQQKQSRFKDVDFFDPDLWNELGLSPCLEQGRRQQLIALARKHNSRTEGEGLSIDTSSNADLEQALSPTSPDVASPGGDAPDRPNGLSMGVIEGLTDQPPTSPGEAELPADDSEQDALQPSNRQGAKRNVPSDPTSPADFDKLEYATQSWLYLERTLSEVRQFWSDIEHGFSPTKHAAGEYPPMMLLTSGRTPCVRGALVGVDAYTSKDPTEDGWKDDVRAGDYSRMTYGAGDGVITRRSATTLPGQWARLLAKREETETLPQELWGKGPPFKKKLGKGRLKMDRYAMRFDGEGVVESSHRHVTLLSDVDGIGKCLEAVRRANLVRGRLAHSPEETSS
uniref:Lecithin:cholesterol acyltransferase n=2 Tax=Kalmanozyma brasiliensis (strain GHG001) TaxID=1365824 RepID=V5GIM4_KALBG